MHFILFFGLVGFVGLFFFLLSRRNRAETVQLTPLSQDDWAIVFETVPITRRLPQDMHQIFGQKIQKFRRQIDFIGCDGLEISRNMELTIAAQACLLVVNTKAWYNRLKTVLVYPGAFKSSVQEFDGTVMHEYEAVRLGESWLGGPVVLSWEHSASGALFEDDGHNLVIHEFAHQLDDLSGVTDAVPLLRDGQNYQEWRSVFEAAYQRHVVNVQRGRKTILDEYGAEDLIEFFAVAVEVFFEKPTKLKKQEPEIYEQLSLLLQLDPVAW